MDERGEIGIHSFQSDFGKDGGERGEHCGEQCPDKPVLSGGHNHTILKMVVIQFELPVTQVRRYEGESI